MILFGAIIHINRHDKLPFKSTLVNCELRCDFNTMKKQHTPTICTEVINIEDYYTKEFLECLNKSSMKLCKIVYVGEA